MRAAAVLLATASLAAWPLACAAAPDPHTDTHAAHAAPVRNQGVQGWGVFANLNGQTLDIRARDAGWADDPHARAGDVQAGLGWRRDRVSTVLGYQETDYGRQTIDGPGVNPMNDPRPREENSAILGFGFALHSR